MALRSTAAVVIWAEMADPPQSTCGMRANTCANAFKFPAFCAPADMCARSGLRIIS